MARRPFYWVDAFSGIALGGNPCAVVLDCDEMDSSTMQALAREMNISETAFVMGSDVADFRARYFTTEQEIPLAGHPTIASLFALVDAGRLSLTGDLTRCRLELNVGPIDVEVLASEGHPSAVIMSQMSPEFLRRYEAGEVVDALGLEAEEIMAGAPIQVVSTGTPQLMVPVRDRDVLMKARVVLEPYLSLTAGGEFLSTHLFCLQGATSAGQTFARHFSHRDGSLEDPFTGSSTGGMGAYLWHHGLIEEPRFVAQQGHWLGRPGEAGVEVVGEPDAIRTVRVAGAGRVLVRGELDL